MAEDNESGPVSHDPRNENHIQGDRQSSQKFFEGRRIDHHWSPGSGSVDNRSRLQKILDGLKGRNGPTAHHEIKDQKKYWENQDEPKPPEEKTDKA